MKYFKNSDELQNHMKTNNLLFKCVVGSNLYGTETPESDKDYLGVYMPTKQLVYGMQTMAEIEDNSNKTNTKNSKDDIDMTYYALDFFFKLAYKNGPNCVELFFIPEDKIIHTTPLWESVSGNYELFISQLVFKSMFAYAFNQRHLARTKRDRFLSIENGINYLEDLSVHGCTRLGEEELAKLEDYVSAFKNKSGKKKGYMLKQPIDQILESLKNEMAGYGHRAVAAMEKAEFDYKYDWKFASHAVRLLYQCIELAETGKIVYPMKDVEVVKDIKLGKYKINEMEDVFTELDNKFQIAKAKTTLQKTPDYHKINKLLISIYDEHFAKND